MCCGAGLYTPNLGAVPMGASETEKKGSPSQDAIDIRSQVSCVWCVCVWCVWVWWVCVCTRVRYSHARTPTYCVYTHTVCECVRVWVRVRVRVRVFGCVCVCVYGVCNFQGVPVSMWGLLHTRKDMQQASQLHHSKVGREHPHDSLSLSISLSLSLSHTHTHHTTHVCSSMLKCAQVSTYADVCSRMKVR